MHVHGSRKREETLICTVDLCTVQYGAVGGIVPVEMWPAGRQERVRGGLGDEPWMSPV
jgi:hypothetical protein